MDLLWIRRILLLFRVESAFGFWLLAIGFKLGGDFAFVNALLTAKFARTLRLFRKGVKWILSI